MPPAAPPSARAPRWSPKKGVGSSDFPGVRRAMTAAHVAWFYHWSPSPQRQGVPGVEFVPMISGAGQVDATDLATARRSGRTLLGYLQRTYGRWHEPIWVTEYAMVDFGHGGRLPPASVQAHVASASVAMLDRLPYVERYAWFALPATGGIGTGLYTAGGRPTTVGRAYAAAGRAR